MSKPKVIEVRLLEKGVDLHHVHSPFSVAENSLSDISILHKALILQSGHFALWRRRNDSMYVSETLNYPHLFQEAPAKIDLDSLYLTSAYLRGDFALLIDPWSYSFYHWFEQLFRAFILEKSGFDGTYIVDKGGAFRKESLEAIGIPNSRVIEHDEKRSVLLERLWITSKTRIDNVHRRPTLFWSLRSTLLQGKQLRKIKDKVYAVRGKNTFNSRSVVNYDEVEDIMRSFDYKIVDFGNLDFASQINAASNARAFAGAHGASFCHVMFMEKMQAVVEFFSPLYINYSISPFLDMLEHTYFPLTSRSTEEYLYGHNAYVDIPILKITLKKIDSLL